MGFNKPPGVPCPPGNPHCNGDVPDVQIDNWVFMSIATILIIIYIYYIMKPKVKITVADTERLNKVFSESNLSFANLIIDLNKIDNRSKFEKIYDKVSTFLFGEKSFKWGELKGL